MEIIAPFHSIPGYFYYSELLVSRTDNRTMCNNKNHRHLLLLLSVHTAHCLWFSIFSCLLNVEWRGLFFLDAQLSGSEQKKKEGMTHCYLLTAKMGGSRFRSMGFITMNTCWFLCSRPAGSRNAYVITEHCNYFVFFFFFILIIIRKKERKIMHTALQ